MMQRNIRNEIMIAVGAVLIIAFGLVFAVLLTGNPEQATSTPETQSPRVTISETERSGLDSTDESPNEEISEVVAQAASEVASETEVEPSDTDEPTVEASATASDTASPE